MKNCPKISGKRKKKIARVIRILKKIKEYEKLNTSKRS